VVGVLFIDVDDFKVVNDTMGHEIGDRLLEVVADRLAKVLLPGDTAARLGGDEFVVLATSVTDEAGARALADRLRALADEPVRWNGEDLHFGVSVGVAAWGPLDRPNGDVLLAVADEAMYAEKIALKQAAVRQAA
jgi:diguanylate cyclase (GGDEF)-like protein